MLKYKSLIIPLYIVIILLYFISPTQASFAIIFNFDDGYQGVYDNAFPSMQTNSIPGVFFIPTKFVGTKDHISIDQLKILKENGWEIGSHTVHHPNLLDLIPWGIQNEITESKNFLINNGLVSNGYISFCSPMTKWNQEIERIVSSEYQLARAKVIINLTTGEKIPGLIKVVVNNTTLKTFKLWIREARKKDLTLILVFHDLSTNKNIYTYNPEKFAILIDFIKTKNYPVKTFHQLYNQITD